MNGCSSLLIPLYMHYSSARSSPVRAGNDNSVYNGRTMPSNLQYVHQMADSEKEPLISHSGLGDSTNHIHDDFEYEADSQDDDTEEDDRTEQTYPFSSASAPQNYNTYYEINEIIEMGKMASLFFNSWGRTLFYLCITIYLYGDLAIYAAAVAKSLRDVACTFTPANTSRSTGNISEDALCWKDAELTRIDAYR